MKCLDGPAMGQHFSIRRAPVFIRVVQDRRNEQWDVLDLLEDEPTRHEDIHVYTLASEPVVAFIRPGGRRVFADYRHVPTMPEEEADLRDNDRWQKWCVSRTVRGVRSTTQSNDREERMEDPKEGGELREEDVTRGDNLDDKVAEGDGLGEGPAGQQEGEDTDANVSDDDA